MVDTFSADSATATATATVTATTNSSGHTYPQGVAAGAAAAATLPTVGGHKRTAGEMDGETDTPVDPWAFEFVVSPQSWSNFSTLQDEIRQFVVSGPTTRVSIIHCVRMSREHFKGVPTATGKHHFTAFKHAIETMYTAHDGVKLEVRNADTPKQRAAFRQEFDRWIAKKRWKSVEHTSRCSEHFVCAVVVRRVGAHTN